MFARIAARGLGKSCLTCFQRVGPCAYSRAVHQQARSFPSGEKFSLLTKVAFVASATVATGFLVSGQSLLQVPVVENAAAERAPPKTPATVEKATPKPPVAVENDPPKATAAGIKGTTSERTFIAVKPDGVQRGLVGEIIKRFEQKGYKLVGLKLLVPSKQLAEEHYADLNQRPFFKGLVDYMTNGKAPVVAMCWQGKDVIRQGRKIIGATNPLDAEPGTIRADYCLAIGRNIIHGSDSFESAETEISLWFGDSVVEWKQANDEWINSAN